ncbi:MAG: hypothetical protein ABL903_03385 [Methylococcales bacterium]
MGFWLLLITVLGVIQSVYADGTTIVAQDKTVWEYKGHIEHRNLDGSMISQFAPPSSLSPALIAVAPNGSVWLARYHNILRDTQYGCYDVHSLQNFKADGTFINQIDIPEVGTTVCNGISEVAFAPDGSLWVVDDINRIQHFKPDGTLIASLRNDREVSPHYYGQSPIDIAFATDGSVWVKDGEPFRHPSRFSHFAADGHLIRQFFSPRTIEDFAVAADGSLWMTSDSTRCLEHFNDDGTLIKTFGVYEDGARLQDSKVIYFTLSVDGNVWIQRRDPTDSLIMPPDFHPFDPTNAEVNLPFPTAYDEQQQKLYLHDVVVDEQHYQAVLQNQNGQFRLFSASAASKIFSLADSSTLGGFGTFDPTTGKDDPTILCIPVVKVSGRRYIVKLKNLGNYVFVLQSVTPL